MLRPLQGGRQPHQYWQDRKDIRKFTNLRYKHFVYLTKSYQHKQYLQYEYN